MADSAHIAQAASRALEDAAYAQQILQGNPDLPEVRDAILKDLAEASNQEVQAYVLNFNPATNPAILRNYIASTRGVGGANLGRLANSPMWW